MHKFRVLIVDDSVVVRRLMSEALAGDPEIEVAGVAANGRIGLARIPQVVPDVVVLDLAMPEMDGLQALAAIRADYPKLAVIVFSALTQPGAAATLDALALGASDYVTKPSSGGDAAWGRVRDELIARVKLFGRAARGTTKVAIPAIARATGARRHAIEVVAVATSTGGPDALFTLLKAFPADFPTPVLIVQHMPPLFTGLLAERLDATTPLSVSECRTGEMPRAGSAVVAAGDRHMIVARDGLAVHLETHQGPPENSCRPSADVLFRSVASAYGPSALALVLTGMGQDGLRGCEAVRAAGGEVFVQDEETSVVWGMPGAVARAGLADRILPLGQLGPEVVRRVRRGQALPNTA